MDFVIAGQLKEALAGLYDGLPLVSEAGLIGIRLEEVYVDTAGLVVGSARDGYKPKLHERKALSIRQSEKRERAEQWLEEDRRERLDAFLAQT